MNKVKAHWDAQATKGGLSGTQDRIAKQLEMEAISRYVKDGMRVLDVGCGDGETLILLATSRNLKSAIGIDYSQDMIEQAIKSVPKKMIDKIYFTEFDIKWLEQLRVNQFDLIYTERALINLPTWEEQLQAIKDIRTLLKPGGLYLMCECFQDGLDDINRLRNAAGLESIAAPWHNLYLEERKILSKSSMIDIGMSLEDRVDYSANYYFLSRVVNAYAAKVEGKEINYEHPINQLALKLPGKTVNMRGQGQLWVWRR